MPFEQTLQRHATKPQASDYDRAEMSAWWHEHDLLPGGFEQIITAGATAEELCLKLDAFHRPQAE